MKKLMKKKVNVFGKTLSVFIIMIVAAIGLTSAALVGFLSNTVSGTVDVSSPITLEVIGGNDITLIGPESYSASIYGGESYSVDVQTTIHVDGVTGHVAENKIANFDGLGITIEYVVSGYPGVFEIPTCTIVENGQNNTYFYIGDSSETLDTDTFTSTTTFIAALNLDPDDSLNVESKVIMADTAKCNADAPTFIPT